MRVAKLLRAGAAGVLLVSTACADPSVEGTAGDARPRRVSGTLTLDGKTSELRHAYAFRTPYGEGMWEVQSSPAIQVVLANEPIPDALLPEVEETLRKDQLASLGLVLNDFEDLLKGTSLQLLVLTVPKDRGAEGAINYESTVCRDGITADSDESAEFGAFTVRDGVVRARASHTWTDEVYVMGPDEIEDREVTCSFSADFEVAIGGAPLPYAGHPASDPLPPLVPGRAEGTFRTEKGSVPLAAAYARRIKIFFDEPEERILVAITNRALPKAALLSLLDDISDLTREHKLRGIRFTVSQNGTLKWSVPYDENGVLLSTNVFESNECRIEGNRLIGKVTYKNEEDRLEYTVSFDVPITPG